MNNDDDQHDDQPDDEQEALDDAELFRQQMQGVVPLKADNRVNDRPAPKKPPVKPRTDIEEGETRFADFEVLGDVPDILNYTTPGIQHSKLAKLRQGKLNIEESIDLHGSTVAQARQYLVEFLEECRQQHITVVLIVHGKGNRSKGKVPVIKAMLNRWLREAPEVLAFHSAQQNDGGTGALYVLLKNYHRT